MTESSRTWEPRIRHISGVGVHELTLPAGGFGAGGGGAPGYHLGAGSGFGSSSTGPGSVGGSPRQRRTSHVNEREIAPYQRKRAPTLAGEGYLPPSLHAQGTLKEITVEEEQPEARPLARCFIAFCVPASPEPQTPAPRSPYAPHSPYSPTDAARRSRTLSSASVASAASAKSTKSTPGRTLPIPSSTSSSSPSPSPTSPTPTGSSRQPHPKSLTTPTRQRTTSLPPKPTTPRSGSPSARRPQPNGKPPALAAAAASGKRAPTRPAPMRRSTALGFPSRTTPLSLDSPRRAPAPPAVPFFLSPIHDPSTHPRWAYLEPGDFASWLTVPEVAGTLVDVQVWVEEGAQVAAPGSKDQPSGKWRRLPGVGGVVDLARLVPVPPGAVLAPNTLQFTLNTHPRAVFYLPPPGTPPSPTDIQAEIMQRSLRETRMQKGTSVGALHQLVNLQAVIADTKRSIADLQGQIDTLVATDKDRTAVRRDISERSVRVVWTRDRVAEVERTIEEAKARITLHVGQIDQRRALLAAAVERSEQTRSHVIEVSAEITRVESERSAILPTIYRLRSQHAQALDMLFPIVPLSPSTLLYSILGVPLPIPQGPKDPAPPLTLTPSLTPDACPRIDERTTAAALGYAALVVHLISLLGGAAAGLAYPVTYAGSRSHVRDVVSVMQGPRSFPLYARGVERYRYEYAVFLLNKDIELLMHEADIRMLDLRHTLPNLKNLLLTLSSPDPPPPGPVTGPGWASGAASRASSRTPSAAWGFPSFPASRRSSGRHDNPNMSDRTASLAFAFGRNMSLSSFEPGASETPSLTAASNVSVGPTEDGDHRTPPATATVATPRPSRARLTASPSPESSDGTRTEGYTAKGEGEADAVDGHEVVEA